MTETLTEETPPAEAPERHRELEALFSAVGASPVAFERGSPLDVADPKLAWAILEGKVDVFFIGPPDAAGISRRTFLVRASAGQILFGLSTVVDKPPSGSSDHTVYGLRSGFGITLAEGWSIVGVPVPGTRCMQSPVASLAGVRDEQCVAKLVECVDEWVKLLCVAMGVREFPKQFERIENGTTRTFQQTNRVVVANGVGWLTLESGRVRVNGVNDAGLRKGQGLPLSTDAWLECDEAVVLKAEATREVILAGRMFGLLERLQNRFVARAAIHGELDRASNRRRIEKKEEDSRKAINLALLRLNQVIEPDLQTEAWESGGDRLLEALVVIGRHVGINFRPRAQREDSAEANPLEAYVRQAKARHRSIALRGQWWKHDNGALLAFLEADKAPVALIPDGRKGYLLHDPGKAGVQVVDEDVAATLAPMGHMFYRGFGDGPMTIGPLMRFGAFGLLPDIGMVIFIGLAVGALGLLTPYVTGILFDTVIPGAQRSQLAQLAMIMLGAAFATAMFEVARSFTVLRVEGKMDSNIQAAVWDRLLRLPVPFFRGYGSGDLALRANGINSIREHLSGSTVHSILSAVFSVSSFFLLFYYSPKLAWIAMGLVAVQVLLTVVFGLIRVRYERRIAEVGGRLASVVLEFLVGIAKLRTTGSEARAFGRWAARHADHESLLIRARNLGNVVTTINAVYPVLCTAVFFFAISYFSQEKQVFSTGEFLAFNSAFGSFMGAMVSMTGTMMGLLAIVPLYERAKPILQTVPEASDTAADPGVISGDIEVSRVSFRYSEDAPAVLSDVSLRIRPGEFVAFVGPSGSGKSTMLRLLLGFEKPSSGSVFYDGQDLASLDVGAVRRQIGVVLQNGQLLAGDIFSNIVGSSGLTIEDARNASKACGLDADIERMPMGMHTLLSDGGGTLSGGQRQRLLIARAIVTKPRVLCFDEATSALDNRNQAIVTASLEQLKATRIVIAHRLSTVIAADRIFVLVGGKLVQQGKFDELMAQEGVFRELASRQMV
jgi:NHLM bacteriocin system ABC transporter ATP-binding protein